MELKNCTKCGKPFVSSTAKICPQCLEAQEGDFKRVREFVKEHPKVSIEVVVDALGVSAEQVRDYLRQGMLDVAHFSGRILDCKRCGKPIESGTYCVLCLKDISNDLKSQPDGKEEAKSDSDSAEEKTAFTRYYRSKRK
jgi:flagellar operon protein (TIGR03826 family)